MVVGRLSLAEQIAQLEETAPADYDPEDLLAREAEVDDEMHVDTSVAREHYLDVGPSSLRRLLPSVADPKYEGVRASRKQLLEESDDQGFSDESEVEEAEHGREEDSDLEEEGSSTSEDLSNDEIPSESEELNEDHKGAAPVQHREGQEKENERTAENISSILKRSREEDTKKDMPECGDALLDTRIRLQKSVVSANRLPPPSQIKDYLDDSRCRDAVSKFLNEASLLTDELFDLQEMLLIANDITTPPAQKRRKLNLDSPSSKEYSEVFVGATEDAAALEMVVHPYLLQTLSKWSAKIQAVAPSVLLPSNRGSFLKGNQGVKSAMQLIDETLQDNSKLLQRTRVVRARKSRIGLPSVQEGDEDDASVDPENFDDTDFYQKVLRDIIDARGNGNKSEDWMLLQKQKKAKKKVDTKASKGRKLRYAVHEKIQNFMVPVPVPDSWHEEQIDELFASLLGKGFESVAINAEEPEVQQSIELSGFRVFG
ncbi:hypothetical protein NLJ89_g1403 [Agrocybe chaxingu]|uniref:Protein BFR2 n=1 Tax=Agrocybe chaxingu TaxID=84603 RepID=A0A9W8N036_9AGAR|nr:hypothetical protein NLJ89_g1403 [Agrocybe chaxingu]